MKFFIKYLLISLALSSNYLLWSVENEPILGSWEGLLTIAEHKMEIKIEVYLKNEYELIGEITLPDLNLYEYKLMTFSYHYPNVYFELLYRDDYSSYSGSITEQNRIVGEFRRGLAVGEFKLDKVSEKTYRALRAKRFNCEEVVLEVDNFTIFGELMVPIGIEEPAVALIVPASGRFDRDGNMFNYPGRIDSYKLLAEQLYKKGIASLRYDKRGVGKSWYHGFNAHDYIFDDFVTDAEKLMAFLKESNRFSSFVFIGHGEGALISMINAPKNGADGLIAISSPGKKFSKIVMDQLSNVSGIDHKEAEEIIVRLKNGELTDQVSSSLQSVLGYGIQPYLVSLFSYDPLTEIQKINKPILIIHGESDHQMSLIQAKELAETHQYTDFLEIENMNYVMKMVEKDDMENQRLSFYNPRIPLAPGLVEAIYHFIRDLKSR